MARRAPCFLLELNFTNLAARQSSDNSNENNNLKRAATNIPPAVFALLRLTYDRKPFSRQPLVGAGTGNRLPLAVGTGDLASVNSLHFYRRSRDHHCLLPGERESGSWCRIGLARLQQRVVSAATMPVGPLCSKGPALCMVAAIH